MQNIYYVVVEQRNVAHQNMMYSMYQVMKVFACDIEHVSLIDRDFVQPLRNEFVPNRGYISTFIFYREATIFQGMAQPYLPPNVPTVEITREEKEQACMEKYKQHEAWEI